MIKSAHQYEVTRRAVEHFEAALLELNDHDENGTHPLILKAQREGIESQLKELHDEVKEWESTHGHIR